MNKTKELTSEQIKIAREWISECIWADLEESDIQELSDESIIKGIKKHFCGGISSFIATCD